MSTQGYSSRKNRLHISKPLQFHRITRGVTKEHGPLLARLTLEPHRGRDNEIDLRRAQPPGNALPLGQGQHHAEMRHRHHVIADLAGGLGGKGRAQMQRQLMPEEIEIHPGFGRAPLDAAQKPAIKAPRRVEIGHIDRQMKRVCHVETPHACCGAPFKGLTRFASISQGRILHMAYGFDTLQIHAGARPDPATGARQVPIYQTTAYVFRDAEHAAALFNLQEVGYIYSRLTNPTVAALQERVATLEGGAGAVCCSSGHAAQIMALFPLMGPGLNVVVSTRLYGGSITQFSQTIKRKQRHNLRRMPRG